jgi:hypothetical protein
MYTFFTRRYKDAVCIHFFGPLYIQLSNNVPFVKIVWTFCVGKCEAFYDEAAEAYGD